MLPCRHGWSEQAAPEDKRGLVVYAVSSRLYFEALGRAVRGGTFMSQVLLPGRLA
jgi:hypothetical protein